MELQHALGGAMRPEAKGWMALITQDTQKPPNTDSSRERKSGVVWAGFLHAA